jgi:hypothetical protein
MDDALVDLVHTHQIYTRTAQMSMRDPSKLQIQS